MFLWALTTDQFLRKKVYVWGMNSEQRWLC